MIYPVTVLSPVDEEIITERGYIYIGLTSDRLRFRSEDSSYDGFLTGDEGINWIAGHHAPDSKEIAALKVAYALGTSVRSTTTMHVDPATGYLVATSNGITVKLA